MPDIAITEKLLKRFMKKAVVSESGCWPWGGYIHKCGYGRIKCNGRPVQVHRVSYMLHKGPIPEGLVIRHTCDNPICVNPGHLLLGTNAENTRDMFERGRNHRFNGERRGEGNPRAKLTDRDVADIKRRVKDGMSDASLAEAYGVSKSTISGIRTNRRWAHVSAAEAARPTLQSQEPSP